MKLGSLKSSNKDGKLVVVSKDTKRAVAVSQISDTLLNAVENWAETEPKLQKVYEDLNNGTVTGEFEVDQTKFHSPLPRTWQWLDGSAFIHHIKLVRMARNAPMPETLETVPLMYQGGSDTFLAPTEDISQVDFSHGTDFEGEVGVILKDTKMCTKEGDALDNVALITMINDVSLRGLIPAELKNGFGFMQSKPSSAFGPFVVTPDELGDAWTEGRVELPLHVELNGEFFGKANGKEMFFGFGKLIEHAAKTRDLAAGTIIGSGTISNENTEMGSSCLAEKRMLEKINDGEFKTPFMKDGDRVKMEMFDKDGNSLFGRIDQKVAKV
ncbi:MAG: fumarylacetoacetate hydrolase family protein [Bdellovibrionales bacterium]